MLADRFRAIVSGADNGAVASLARPILRAFEFPYTWAIQWRNRGYDVGSREVHKTGVPVISVGNLTLGGTGKTPCVAWIARWFRQRGVRVSIVSRGYRSENGAPNDEALELDRQLPDVPHLQNPDRVQAASTAIEELETQLIVLDDGFQHRRLARDLDIVLIDALEPFGFDHVFPRGALREPLSGLRRADIVCVSKCNLVDEMDRKSTIDRIASHNADATLCQLVHAPTRLVTASQRARELSALGDANVAAFCGIGNPDAFRQTLQQHTKRIIGWKTYPDHHRYSREDVEELARWAAESQADMAVCTQKDLVKLNVERLGEMPLYALAIELEVTSGLDQLESELETILALVGRE